MKKLLKAISIISIGILVFIGLISIILFFANEKTPNNVGIPIANTEKTTIPTDTVTKTNDYSISFMEPQSIVGTSFQFMKIVLKSDNSGKASFKRTGYYDEHIVNILFFDHSKQLFNLLFNKKAKILEIHTPSTVKDSLSNLILYRAVTSDTDGDGQLSNNDNSILFISDITGKQLKQITTSKTNFISYRYLGNNQLLISVTIPNNKVEREYWEKEYYLYDIKGSSLKTSNRFMDNLKTSKKIIGL